MCRIALGQQHIVRRQVAMHDALLMGGVHGMGQHFH
jgi:hypothetical protein